MLNLDHGHAAVLVFVERYARDDVDRAISLFTATLPFELMDSYADRSLSRTTAERPGCSRRTARSATARGSSARPRSMSTGAG